VNSNTEIPVYSNKHGIVEVLTAVIAMIENNYYQRNIYKNIFPQKISGSILNQFYSACYYSKSNVIYYAYNSPIVLTYIFISQDTNIGINRLSSRNLQPADFIKLSSIVNKLYKAPLYFEYTENGDK